MKKLSLCLAFATFAFAGAATADTYPSRPITFIVPYGAGGPVDVLARLLTEPMRQALGQPIVIENVAGANGTIGVGRAARAAPDGYTVSIGNSVAHYQRRDLQPELRHPEGFEPVARLPQNPYVAVARKDCPAKTSSNLSPGPRPSRTRRPGRHRGSRLRPASTSAPSTSRSDRHQDPVGSLQDRLGGDYRDIIAGHIDLTFDQAITALSQ